MSGFLKKHKQEGYPKMTSPDERGLEFAWRTHAAISDWTAKVDTKSSIVLSLGGAVLGFCITLTGRGRLLANQHGWHHVMVVIGLVLLSLGVLVAALAVFPRLRRRQAKKNWKQNYLYFGHLRHWKPEHLKKELANQTIDEQLNVLSRQLVTTASISWSKHATLQLAMALLIVGILALGIAVY